MMVSVVSLLPELVSPPKMGVPHLDVISELPGQGREEGLQAVQAVCSLGPGCGLVGVGSRDSLGAARSHPHPGLGPFHLVWSRLEVCEVM